LSEGEPIIQFPRSDVERGPVYQRASTPRQVAFDRKELNLILNLYGKYVASGEWRDYAMDFDTELATFSIFRRSSEVPLYRIVKNPALARKQGVYAVIAQGGLILKRGHDLAQVLTVLIKKPRLAT
jgi:glycogen debranching enzyme